MWSAPSACIVCVLFGILFNVKPVHPEPKLIQRHTDQTPDDVTEFEQDIHKVINQIHMLSGENVNSRSSSTSSTGESFNLNTYYGTLSNLSNIYHSLLREGFTDELPRTLVCLLSGRVDCGLEAELIKTMSLELVKPLLTFVSSLRSHTCTPQSSDGESYSFLKAYLRMGDSATALFTGFQHSLTNMLWSLPLSGNMMSAVSGLVDVAVTYVSMFSAALLQVPMDYFKIALQFGIRLPSLDEEETCEQGDLKQLIMWGMNHNVSWSFGYSIIDILVESVLAPEQSLCTYPGTQCRDPPSTAFQRGASDDTDYKHEMILQCDRHSLAPFNDTQCAAVLMGSRVADSASVLTFCQALSSLNPIQIEQLWSNMCYAIQALASPLLSKSPDCSVGHPQDSPAITPPNETLPGSHSEPRRTVREASSLQQLACNYNSWLGVQVDAVLVSLCSDNERQEFVKQVCNDTWLITKLLSDPMNSWLYGYCGNSSANRGDMVSHFCAYEQWLVQPSVPVGPALLEFCMNFDKPRLIELICEHTGFFMLLFSNPENLPFMPNCTNAPLQPPGSGGASLMLDSCRYSEWHNVMQISTDILSQCIRFDHIAFTQEVCANKTFLNGLLLNKENDWLENHCNTSLIPIPPDWTQPFNIADWCDYHAWGEREVDDSVVGLCWQHDQIAFQKNVCCEASLLYKLLEDAQNKWLSSVCTDIEDLTIQPKVCKYSDWTRPIIVDMTELALCAEVDPFNFISKVCENETVLQNLLANQDNTWLIQHCANHTDLGVSPGGDGGQGGGLTGFNPAEQCQYSSWSISLPDAALLTLCWEHDQTNFVSSVCANANQLTLLSQEPSSVWVGAMCNTYINYTTTTPTGNNSTTEEPTFCLARYLVRQFNWTCSADLTPACEPGARQNIALQMIARCWVESLGPRVEDLLTPSVTSVLEQAVSTSVVILLALEELQNTSLQVTENIRPSVVASIVRFLEREKNFDKKRVLLQCFGRVLTSLMPTARDMTSEEFFIIKEYFSIPLSSLRSVLRGSHVTTVRLILHYYNRNNDKLKLSDEYLSTMVSVLLQTHVVKDGNLFPELASLLAAAAPTDISALPSMQNNINVRETINSNLWRMSLEQRRAFGQWFSKVMTPAVIARGHQSIIRNTGNLIAYLPFYNFQHLSPAQLLDGVDVLQSNTLSSLKQEFVAHSIIGTYRNLTAQHFTRLGNLSCLADPENLLFYRDTDASGVIRDIVMNCTNEGISLPSHLISSLFLNSTELKVPSSLTPRRLAELAPLLPSLGVPFLQGLTPWQLFAALPDLDSASFSPAQASIIVEKISSVNTLTAPGQLRELGHLIMGMKTETLLTLTTDRLLSSLPAMAQLTPGLSPPQANAVSTKLWGFTEVFMWLNHVDPLLHWTPLLSVLPRTHLLVKNLPTASTKHWNTQQAIAIFKMAHETNPNVDFLTLGTLGQGVSCEVLQERFRADSSPSSVRRTLAFLRKQPGPLHTSLKMCVIEELYKFDFYELLEDIGAEIALSMPVSMIKKFSADVMDTFSKTITKNPEYFLLQPRTKQMLLVDKVVQRMGMYTGLFTEEEFLSLGVMAPFVVDEVLTQLDRSFFVKNLDSLRGLCYCSSKILIVANILLEPAVFGPTSGWNQTTLSQVDRFVFFLPVDQLQQIPRVMMTVGRIEKLFMSHRQWEQGDVGSHCLDQNERKTLFEKQQFVLQFFLGFLIINPLSLTPMGPTCEILHTTAPSAWPTDSLTSMSSSAFTNCLEHMGRDQFLTSFQRKQVLTRVKQIYGPVSSFSQSVISQLGGLAVELSVDELRSFRLTERRSIAAMGAVSDLRTDQLAALFFAVLNSTRLSPSQFDSSMLVALGRVVCGATPAEMNLFNAVEFSKAVLWLGKLRLSCSEEQLLALVRLLTHTLAFGPISSWGTDVFIEIGVLAAGLPDMAMSSMVKAQIQGMVPRVFLYMSPLKFIVVFDEKKIGMFSYEQARAVTSKQLSAMNILQQTALEMVLTPWEDRAVDFRGKSQGLALSHNPLYLMLGLLMLIIALLYPGT